MLAIADAASISDAAADASAAAADADGDAGAAAAAAAAGAGAVGDEQRGLVGVSVLAWYVVGRSERVGGVHCCSVARMM